MGEHSVPSTIAAELADALLDVGRVDEAEAMCAVAAEAGAEDDVVTQVLVGLVRGRLAARHGRMDEALATVADALALADRSEYYDLRAPSLLLFAQLLLDAGRLEEARAHAQQVLDLARLRGDVLFESRATDLLDRLAVLRPAAN
jgi:ATP/maltotriose-dependent transcriptional regulator MalT